MGTPQFAEVCLGRLLESAHPVAAVVTRPDRPAGRGQKPRPSPVKLLARSRGIEVIEPAKPSAPEFIAALRALAPDVVVVVAYGRLLPDAVLGIPPHGCINAHPSLLPHLRGAAPIERAILRGDQETGVTIMRINERMDAGDVLMAERVPIGARTDAAALRDALASVAARLLVSALDALAAGRAAFAPQDESLATYAPPLSTEEARIDWAQPAVVLDRAIRAFHPAPGAFTFDRGRRLKIRSALARPGPAEGEPGTVLELAGDGMLVACGEGALLVETVQPEGRRPMSAAEYARGCPGSPPRRLTSAAR
jgi:methionyl-tRNA formyltransferase